MPVLDLPLQHGFNQITPEEKKPSAGTPFNPHMDQPVIKSIDLNLRDSLFRKYRSFITEEINDQNPISIMQLADIYFLKEEYYKSEKHYKKVISISKDYLPAYEKVILSVMFQFPRNYQNVDPKINKFLRDRVNNYFMEYLKAVDRRPDVLHRYVLFRLSLFQDRKDEIADESLSILFEILEKQPSNYQAMDTVGFVYLNFKDNIKEAKKWFNKVLKINKKYVYSLNNLGVCFSKENNFAEAKKYFNFAKKIDDNFSLAYENLGNLQVLEQDYEHALKNLNHALEISDSISRNGYHNLALAYCELGFYHESNALYENILKFEPDNYLVMNNIGTNYSRLNNNDIAKKYYIDSFKTYKNKFHDQKPDIPGITNTLRNLLRVAVDSRDILLIDKTEKDLRAINKKDPYIDYAIACKNLLEENYADANKNFQKLLKKDKHVPETYVIYSFLLSAVLRKYQKTIDLIELASRFGYSNLILDNNLAYAYLNLDKVKEAELIISKYKEGMPDLLVPTKAMLELRKGNFEEGNYLYKKALLFYKNNSKTKKELSQIWLYEKAVYWYRSGKKQKALDLLVKATSLGETYFSGTLSIFYKELTKS